MARARRSFVGLALVLGAGAFLMSERGVADDGTPPATTVDSVGALVSRLDLERFKATIKALTQFGDRRQGTQRNRDAIDWIEAQLKSYGCTNTERITYTYPSPEASAPVARPPLAPVTAIPPAPRRNREGRSTQFGYRAATGVNVDPLKQLDLAVRALDAEPAPTAPGPRQEVYCTKIGATRPDEMYIIGGHMDGHGWGEAADDDGSGTALVMELARILSAPDVKTERSIRFILWNNEETGLNGSYAYVFQRKDLQGIEAPVGSGQFPEPRWLGMITHDMLLWDHGMPLPDGTLPSTQRATADVNIEFQSDSDQALGSNLLAQNLKTASDRYNTDYPATVGPHMTNTDSTPFMDLVPSLSVRENERGAQIGAGWNPNWHQPSDLYTTYSDADFRLGLNAAQTTLAGLGRLTGATLLARTR